MTVVDLYRAFWRHKLLIAVATTAVVAATWVLTSRETKVYEATSLVRVEQSVSSATEAFVALQTGATLARTYAQIATTGAVAKQIQRELPTPVPYSEIAGKITAAQVEDLDLLKISARSTSPTRAAALANAAPGALDSVTVGTGALRDHISTIQTATVPTSAVSPRLKLNVALALLLGLILNGGLALLVDALGDRASDPDELERLTGIPVLATVPPLQLVRAANFDRSLFDGERVSATQRLPAQRAKNA